MRLGYLILYVTDVPAAVAFYERAFGLQLRMQHGEDYAEMRTGTGRLDAPGTPEGCTLAFASHTLAESNGTPFDTGTRPPMELALLADDVPAAFDRAIDAGCEAVSEPATKPWGQVVAYVRDAEGFLVELCTPVVPPTT